LLLGVAGFALVRDHEGDLPLKAYGISAGWQCGRWPLCWRLLRGNTDDPTAKKWPLEAAKEGEERLQRRRRIRRRSAVRPLYTLRARHGHCFLV